MKHKIVVVELYFSCREDVDARQLAAGIVGNDTEMHTKASWALSALVQPPNDYRDLQYSGYTWKETEAR